MVEGKRNNTDVVIQNGDIYVKISKDSGNIREMKNRALEIYREVAKGSNKIETDNPLYN